MAKGYGEFLEWVNLWLVQQRYKPQELNQQNTKESLGMLYG